MYKLIEVPHIFISSDIVNGTKYKIYDSKWIDKFDKFYNLIFSSLCKNNSYKIWKYLGDEVLLYKEFNKVYIKNNINKEIKKISDSFEKIREEYIVFIKKQNKENYVEIDIKCAIWLAGNNEIKLYKYTKGPDKSKIVDFLGEHIDTGFRIAKFVEGNRIIVCYNLAKCLGNCKELFFVASAKLKGISEQKLIRDYPIFWYEKEAGKGDGEFNFKKTFDPRIRPFNMYYRFWSENMDSKGSLLDKK